MVHCSVGGRLELGNTFVAQKHPAILPSKCTFVNRLVRHLHLTNFHAGAKALVALIRNNFWIVNAEISLVAQSEMVCIVSVINPNYLDR